MDISEPSRAATLLQCAKDGILLYGLTPPRLGTTQQKAQDIADATLSRLDGIGIDALIIYDVDAESDRSSIARPFPYAPMMDPADFRQNHLADWAGPAIVYRAVSKYSETELDRWLESANPDRVLTVFVGAASRNQQVKTTLASSYARYSMVEQRPVLGGVTIAERHTSTGSEHHRMLRKQVQGCDFFVSQICYDLDRTLDVLSDYVYASRDQGTAPRPLILTLAPCGSVKTLEFMSWLGIDVPRWLSNEILRSEDPLAVTYEHCLITARSLISFCRRLGLPFGINIESLTNRKVEIEASIDLAREVRGMLS